MKLPGWSVVGKYGTDHFIIHECPEFWLTLCNRKVKTIFGVGDELGEYPEYDDWCCKTCKRRWKLRNEN